MNKSISSNPILLPSTLPYKFPDFSAIKETHLQEAIEVTMKQAKEEIKKIIVNKDAPTFENTIVALEKADDIFSKTNGILSFFSNNLQSDLIFDLNEKLAPKFADYTDEIYMNPILFKKIKTIHEQYKEKQGNDYPQKSEEGKILEHYYKSFKRSGAELSSEKQEELRKINKKLAKLDAQFSKNVLKDTENGGFHTLQVKDLEGLSDNELEQAKENAKERSLEGYYIKLVNLTNHPILENLKVEKVREKIYELSTNRTPKDKNTSKIEKNEHVLIEMVKCRTKQATLLGYESYADYILEEQMAKNSKNVKEILKNLAPYAVQAINREKEKLLNIQNNLSNDSHNDKKNQLAPYNWNYLAEKVKKNEYDFDENDIKPYFVWEKVLHDGVFYAANKLYGVTFKERKDLPSFHKDVTIYEVLNKDGSGQGILFVDPYTRTGKSEGAWQETLIFQSRLLNEKTVGGISLNLNKAALGQKTLISWDWVKTAFHEMGHALHALFSDVKYPSFSGTSVAMDYVEHPSQINEIWAIDTDILKNYARHYQTNEPIPDDLVEKLKKSTKFNQGFASGEFLMAVILDQAWNTLNQKDIPSSKDIAKFEKSVLQEYGLDMAEIQPRYKSPYFSHSFGEYGANYYSYLWGEMLDAIAEKWFYSNGGPNLANGLHFRETILSKGSTREPLELFKDFVDQPLDVGVLAERRGLLEEPQPKKKLGF